MKKTGHFLLFLLSLLFSATAWADGIKVSTSTESPEYVYKIRGGRANQSYFWTSAGGNVKGVESGACFAFYAGDNEGEYYIYSVTDKTYLGYSYSGISGEGRNKAISVSTKADSCLWKITACTSYPDYFQLQPIDADGNAVSRYANWHGGTNNVTHTSIGLYKYGGSNDGGSAWTIALYGDYSYTLAYGETTFTGTVRVLSGVECMWTGVCSDFLTFSDVNWDDDNKTYSATISTATKYMYGFPAGKCYFYATGTAVMTAPNALPTNAEGENERWQWQFVPSVEEGVFCYLIKNVSTGKFIKTAANITLGEESEATSYCYGATGIDNCYGFYVKDAPTTFISSNTTTKEQQAIGWDKPTGSTHKGANLTFETPADFDALMTSLKAANTTAGTYTVGTAIGQYTATDGFAAAKTKAAAIIAGTEYATAAGFTACTDSLSASNLTLNLPQAGGFYTLQETTTSQYLTPNLSTVSGQTGRLAMSKTVSDAERIFYFDGTNLMGYSNGYYLGLNSESDGFLGQAAVGATGGTTFVFASGSLSECSLCVGFNNNGRTLYGADTGYTGAGSTGLTSDGYRFYVREVTDLPLTIGSNGWSTFSAPVAVTVPDGVTAYYAPSEPSGDKLLLEEVTGAVPANTGIIVRGTEGTTVNFSTVTSSTEEASLSGNLLQSNVSVNSIEGTSGDGKYALVTNIALTPKVTGFMKLTTTVALPGHKCWLQATASASSGKFLPIVTEDDPTGIGAAETAVGDSDAPVYDLQGRRVASTRKGGMYIQNGKVFIAM